MMLESENKHLGFGLLGPNIQDIYILSDVKELLDENENTEQLIKPSVVAALTVPSTVLHQLIRSVVILNESRINTV